MEYVPRGTFHAYALLFSIGMLTSNLYVGFRSVERERSQVQTARWLRRFIQAARKIVGHGRQAFLKIGAGDVHGDRRALRALHAGRRRHSRTVVIAGAAFSHSFAPNKNRRRRQRRFNTIRRREASDSADARRATGEDKLYDSRFGARMIGRRFEAAAARLGLG